MRVCGGGPLVGGIHVAAALTFVRCLEPFPDSVVTRNVAHPRAVNSGGTFPGTESLACGHML
jgi:hypothetical protein